MTTLLATLVALGAQTAASADLIPKLSQAIEVPMDFEGTAIFLRGSINGKPAQFFFDTGFSGAILISDQIDVGPKAGTIPLVDFVGVHEVPTVKVNTVTIGGMKFNPKNLEVPQEQVSDIGESYGKHCDAMLGFELFSPYVFELNFKNKKLIFHPSDKVDISKRKPDNVNTFLLEMLPFGEDQVNLVVSYKEHKIPLAFDTGNAFFLTTFKEFLTKFGVYNEDTPQFMKQSMVASGATDSFAWWAHDWKIGTIPLDHAVFDILDLPSTSAHFGGTIGIGFIQKFNSTIDFRRRLVWMERVEPYKFEPPKAELGIHCAFDEKKGRWRIFALTKNSPASNAGLQRGDILFGVDDADIRNMTRKQLEDLIDGPQGSEAKVTVSRGGNLMRFKVKREHLINGTAPDAPKP